MESKEITFAEIVNACLHKPGFFHQLRENPAHALREHGFQATPMVLDALKSFDYNSVRQLYFACNPDTGPVC